MYSLQELLLSVSLSAYLMASVIIAAVRWGHKCQPFAKYPDYYYPAWKAIVLCFLTNLELLPVVFLPGETDAILQLRMMLILCNPFLCAVVIFSYFGKVLNVTWWKKPIYTLTGAFNALSITAMVLTLIPGTQLTGTAHRWYFGITGTLAVLFMTCFILSIHLIAHALHRFDKENYSNPEDFPQRFARRIIWVPLSYVGIGWTCAFFGPVVLSICLIVLSFLGVIFLISVLEPHRSMDIEKMEIEVAAPEEVPAPEEIKESISQANKDRIIRSIRKYVEEQQAYLDSHLTLASLSREIGINRSYVSQVMTENFGGFFNYVNRCRLEHADRLKAQNPDIQVGDLIVASGFGSRQSYYNVKKQLS